MSFSQDISRSHDDDNFIDVESKFVRFASDGGNVLQRRPFHPTW